MEKIFHHNMACPYFDEATKYSPDSHN